MMKNSTFASFASILMAGVLVAFICSCSTDRKTEPTGYPTVPGGKMVWVTIEGDVKTPGKCQIPQSCGREAFRKAAGGWLTRDEGELTTKVFYVYREAGGATNHWRIRFRDDLGKPRDVPFESGDRIVVNTIPY